MHGRKRLPAGGRIRPARIGVERPSHRYEIRFAALQQAFSGLRLGDSSDDRDGQAELAVPLRKATQDAFLPLTGLDDPLAGFVGPRGDVQEVEPIERGLGHDLEGLIDPEPVGWSFESREANAQRCRGDGVTDGVDHLGQEPGGRSPLVIAEVRPGRHELMDEVSVRPVEHEDVDAGVETANRCLGVAADQVADVVSGERFGDLPACDGARHGRGRDASDAVDGRLGGPASVVELDAKERPVAVDPLCQFSEWRHDGGVVDAHLISARPAIRANVGGLGENDRRPSGGAGLEITDVRRA